MWIDFFSSPQPTLVLCQVWKAVPFSQVGSGPLRPPDDTVKSLPTAPEAKKSCKLAAFSLAQETRGWDAGKSKEGRWPCHATLVWAAEYGWVTPGGPSLPYLFMQKFVMPYLPFFSNEACAYARWHKKSRRKKKITLLRRLLVSKVCSVWGWCKLVTRNGEDICGNKSFKNGQRRWKSSGKMTRYLQIRFHYVFSIFWSLGVSLWNLAFPQEHRQREEERQAREAAAECERPSCAQG